MNKCFFCEKGNGTETICKDIKVCYKCSDKFKLDYNRLKLRPSEIWNKELKAWLKKWGKTNHKLFISGCYNKQPDKLLLSEDKLSQIPLKSL
jgi:ribosomal protein L24E